MDAVKVFNKTNLGAFVKQVRERFDAAARQTARNDDRLRDHPDYLRRRWGEVLRTLYKAQKNVTAFVALAEETGLAAKDCHAIARLLISKRKPEEALSWVDRGFDVDKQSPHGSIASHDLAKLKRDLLSRLGRGDEALDAAWSDYRRHPSAHTYDELMKYVPKAQRKEWHEKAIEAVMDADLRSIVDLLLKTKELDRLAEVVRRTNDDDLEDPSHYTTEPVAKKFEKPHPDLAARLWRAQGLRIVKASKSRYYDAALSNFERAKRCFERSSLEDEWSETVRQVRAAHHRKSSFMPGFERLVEGVGPSDEPSFLDRAKARWRTKERGAR
jgi:tetratricopeptide (TPR) repeat protein